MIHFKSPFLVCSMFVLFFSCGKKSIESSTAGGSDSLAETSESPALARSFSPGDTASYAMNFDQAKEMVSEYVDFANRNYNSNPFAKAFLIRSSTLQEVMLTDSKGDPRVDYVRAYIGLDGSGEFRLFLVPVKEVSASNQAGVDSLMNGPYTNGVFAPGDSVSNGNYVWDYAKACPLICPKLSSKSLYVN